MRGRRILYSDAEIAWLAANRSMVISEYHRAFCQQFSRDDVSAGHLHALRKRKGWKTGRVTTFPKGNQPANKGKKCPPGEGGRHPNALRTQFKPGSLSGRAAAIKQPIGAERISVDGYLERKINNDLPMQARWKAVHRIEWEAVNGPVPAGHALKCLDGNKLNTAASNWEAVHRGVLARLNGGRMRKRIAYDDAPDELKPTVMAVAKLEHQTHTRRRRKESEGPPHG